jgi:methyl-accepting chemotaxis protein
MAAQPTKFQALLASLSSRFKKIADELPKAEAEIEAAAKTAATAAGRTAADVTAAAKKVAHTVEATAEKAVTTAKKKSTSTVKKTVKKVESTVKTATGKPDASWTVAELRAFAKNKGIVGYSSKTKPELLKAIAAKK